MNVFERLGVRGAGEEAEGRRERAKRQAAEMKALDGMMPGGAFAPFLTPEEIRIAGCVEPGNKLLALVRDVIRRRHMAVLVELYQWEPGTSDDVLLCAAARVKELVELDQALTDIVEKCGSCGAR